MKMSTKDGIFIFINRQIFLLSYVYFEKIANVSNLNFICKENFISSWVEHEKRFIASCANHLKQTEQGAVISS